MILIFWKSDIVLIKEIDEILEFVINIGVEDDRGCGRFVVDGDDLNCVGLGRPVIGGALVVLGLGT